ncbi:MAG: hypothetical protein SFW66_02760 [Gammaproteobacteria bacterium]|nr:hypothetical protein [Gammaproteobacteria bacterium]
MRRKKSRATSKKVTRVKATQKKSSAIRAIQKSETLIAREQAKLAKQYSKSLRATEKLVAKLTAQLDKIRRSNQPNAKPMRGRKPSKAAVKALEALHASANADKQFLKENQDKFVAQQKAVATFLKEWKNKSLTPRKVKSKKSSPVKSVDAEKSSEFVSEEQPAFEIAS